MGRISTFGREARRSRPALSRKAALSGQIAWPAWRTLLSSFRQCLPSSTANCAFATTVDDPISGPFTLRCGGTGPTCRGWRSLLSTCCFKTIVDLRGLSFTERQRDLKRLCANRRVPCLFLVEIFPEGGPLLEWCSNYGLEGIVSKRRASGYASGPSRPWVKTKCANWKRENDERHRMFEINKKSEPH